MNNSSVSNFNIGLFMDIELYNNESVHVID